MSKVVQIPVEDINALGDAFKTIETIFNRYGLFGGNSEPKATKPNKRQRIEVYKSKIEKLEKKSKTS